MASVASLIGKCLEAVEVPGEPIDLHKVIEFGLPLVEADDEIRPVVIRHGLGAMAKNHVGSHNRKLKGAGGSDEKQMDMFGLRSAYVLDEGKMLMKRRDDLTLPDLRGLIRVRREQLIADGNHLQLLEKAEERLGPIWEQNPEMRYAVVCAIYGRMRDAAE